MDSRENKEGKLETDDKKHRQLFQKFVLKKRKEIGW